jgi:hypothetical protein
MEVSPDSWSDVRIRFLHHCCQVRLYSVVVSTLVFETDILSISEYREPGFEPQYDLSFCLMVRGLYFLGMDHSV